MMSTMLYGCESWLEGNIKPIEKLYNWCVKQLLGVRLSTCSEVCSGELGLPTFKYLVKSKQRKFFQSLWGDRQHMRDDPWAHFVKIVLDSNTGTGRYINSFITEYVDDVSQGKDAVKLSIANSMYSRRIVYKPLNAENREKKYVNEVHRLAYSQFRVSGHWLAIEIGRWNSRERGRLYPTELKVAVEAGPGDFPSVAIITVYFFLKPRSSSLTPGSVFLSLFLFPYKLVH